MKRRILALLALAAGLTAGRADDFQAALKLDAESIMAGEPVYVAFTVKNNSQAPKELLSIDLSATDADGAAVRGLHGYENARQGKGYGTFGGLVSPIGAGDTARFWITDAPVLQPGEERTERLVLPGNFAVPGKYTITAACRFMPKPNPPPAPVLWEIPLASGKDLVKATAPIVVTARDESKLGDLIDSLGKLALAANGDPTKEQWEAFYKLAAIDDERAIPLLLRFVPPRYTAFEPVALFGLSKFSEQTVGKVLKKYPSPKMEAARYDYAKVAARIQLNDTPLREAVEANNPWLVKWLVEQGEDSEPFDRAEDFMAKFWAVPPNKEAVSPDLTIEVPKNVKRDADIPIHIVFKNTTNSVRFFNPKLNPNRYDWYLTPVGILLFDERGRCIGDLFDTWQTHSGGGAGTNPGWISKGEVRPIDTKFIIPSKKFDTKSGRLLPIRFPSKAVEKEIVAHGIPPGHYTVQMVMWLRAIAPLADQPGTAMSRELRGPDMPGRWGMHGPRLSDYYQNPLWYLPIYRSNPVALDVDLPGENAAPAPPPKPEEKGVIATIVPDKTSLILGEPLYVSVTIKNHTGNDYSMLESFIVSAKDPAGNDIKPKAPTDGRNGTMGLFYMLDNPGLKSGEERTERIFVPANVLFTAPGDYTLAVSASARGGPKEQSITATGKAKITVTPRDDVKMMALVDDLLARLTPVEGYNYEQEEAKLKLITIGGDRIRDWCAKALASNNDDAQVSAISILEQFDYEGARLFQPHAGKPLYATLTTAMDNTLKFPDYESASAKGENYLMPRARLQFIDYLRYVIQNGNEAENIGKVSGRPSAGMAAIRVDKETAIKYLLGLARHPDPGVRLAVMSAIPYQISTAKALDTIRELARDKEANIRERAKFILEDFKATGK